jgi:radical SAM superfamily enzyme YgiQ (UPF0313 family)
LTSHRLSYMHKNGKQYEIALQNLLTASFGALTDFDKAAKSLSSILLTDRHIFMKILMVSPESPDTFWSLKHALKFISKKATVPPLGLLTVAAMLPVEWEIKLIDMAVTELSDRDIRWADYVFISAMYIHKDSVRHIIDRCKKIGRKIVAGGPLFTQVPEEYDDIDHLVLNEAEITLPQFLKDLAKGSARHIYTSDEWANMHDTPTPLWKLLNTKSYAAMSIQYSRGCPFDCDFCDVTTLFGRKSRVKSRTQILEELESLCAHGWRGDVFFVDDNLIGNKAHLKKEILPAIIDWMEKKQYPLSYNTQASINLADDSELMQLMVKAGFDCVFVGIETPNEISLAECNKVQNKNRDLVESVRKIQRCGMQVQGGFILGFDNDTQSIFDNMIRFIQESGIVTAMVGLLNAPKGTKLYNRLMAEGRLLNFGSGNNTDFSMNFVPMMDYKELAQGYKKVVQTIYSGRYFYNRVLTFLRDYKPVQNGGIQLKFNYINAFVKSLWHIGVMGKDRKYYWKLVFWSLVRLQYLDTVVMLIIFGYHFRTVFENLQLRAPQILHEAHAAR